MKFLLFGSYQTTTKMRLDINQRGIHCLFPCCTLPGKYALKSLSHFLFLSFLFLAVLGVTPSSPSLSVGVVCSVFFFVSAAHWEECSFCFVE